MKDGRLLVSFIDDYDHFRWRDGLVCFDNIAFNELMKRFEKCYGISIVVENKNLEEYSCSGNSSSDGLIMRYVFCSGMLNIRLNEMKIIPLFI